VTNGFVGVLGERRDITSTNELIERANDTERTFAAMPFFRGVEPAVVAEIAGRCRWIDIEAGTVLVGIGEQPEKVFFLISGELRLWLYTKEGKILSLPCVSPGAVVGVHSLTLEVPVPYSINVTRDSTLAWLNTRVFRDFLQRDPAMVEALLAAIIEHKNVLISHIVELTTLSVRDRIHNELGRLCRDSTGPDGSAVIFPLPTHEELANRVGTQREAVSRELSQLQSTGVIMRQNGALLVPDVSRLREPQAKPRN